MTALPLFWGEGGIGTVLNGDDQRAPVIRFLAEYHDLIPADTLDPAQWAKVDLLILAQPRLLAPEELVALDDWIRKGGKALIFADPELHWPSSLPLGDLRRPPPVTLLDPLFAHWGVEMLAGHSGQAEVDIEGETVTLKTAGRWRGLGRDQEQGEACRIDAQGYLARCTLGKGHALLLGDADFLEHRDAGENLGQQSRALLHLVRSASGYTNGPLNKPVTPA